MAETCVPHEEEQQAGQAAERLPKRGYSDSRWFTDRPAGTGLEGHQRKGEAGGGGRIPPACRASRHKRSRLHVYVFPRGGRTSELVQLVIARAMSLVSAHET